MSEVSQLRIALRSLLISNWPIRLLLTSYCFLNVLRTLTNFNIPRRNIGKTTAIRVSC